MAYSNTDSSSASSSPMSEDEKTYRQDLLKAKRYVVFEQDPKQKWGKEGQFPTLRASSDNLESALRTAKNLGQIWMTYHWNDVSTSQPKEQRFFSVLEKSEQIPDEDIPYTSTEFLTITHCTLEQKQGVAQGTLYVSPWVADVQDRLPEDTIREWVRLYKDAPELFSEETESLSPEEKMKTVYLVSGEDNVELYDTAQEALDGLKDMAQERYQSKGLQLIDQMDSEQDTIEEDEENAILVHAVPGIVKKHPERLDQYTHNPNTVLAGADLTWTVERNEAGEPKLTTPLSSKAVPDQNGGWTLTESQPMEIWKTPAFHRALDAEQTQKRESKVDFDLKESIRSSAKQKEQDRGHQQIESQTQKKGEHRASTTHH